MPNLAPAFANSVDSDLLKPIDLDQQSLIMRIYSNDPDQAIWLDEN